MLYKRLLVLVFAIVLALGTVQALAQEDSSQDTPSTDVLSEIIQPIHTITETAEHLARQAARAALLSRIENITNSLTTIAQLGHNEWLAQPSPWRQLLRENPTLAQSFERLSGFVNYLLGYGPIVTAN